MNKEELIGKLQMVYVWDRNALNELIGYYDGLKQVIDELQQENKQLKDNWNKIEQIIENERMSHWAPSPLFLTELLSKMQELEKGNSNE